jgi:hypothetical protein
VAITGLGRGAPGTSDKRHEVPPDRVGAAAAPRVSHPSAGAPRNVDGVSGGRGRLSAFGVRRAQSTGGLLRTSPGYRTGRAADPGLAADRRAATDPLHRTADERRGSVATRIRPVRRCGSIRVRGPRTNGGGSVRVCRPDRGSRPATLRRTASGPRFGLRRTASGAVRAPAPHRARRPSRGRSGCGRAAGRTPPAGAPEGVRGLVEVAPPEVAGPGFVIQRRATAGVDCCRARRPRGSPRPSVRPTGVGVGGRPGPDPRNWIRRRRRSPPAVARRRPRHRPSRSPGRAAGPRRGSESPIAMARKRRTEIPHPMTHPAIDPEPYSHGASVERSRAPHQVGPRRPPVPPICQPEPAGTLARIARASTTSLTASCT